MLGCLCKGIFREEGATHCKMEKLEIRAVIKYFCRKGMHLKENHKDFKETLREESSFYSTVKKEFSRGRERALRIMYGLAAPKMPALMKTSRSCIPWLCVIGGVTCGA